MISAGDNFYPYGIQSNEVSQLEELLKDYGPSSIPWYPIVGNHDCRGNIQAQVS